MCRGNSVQCVERGVIMQIVTMYYVVIIRLIQVQKPKFK